MSLDLQAYFALQQQDYGTPKTMVDEKRKKLEDKLKNKLDKQNAYANLENSYTALEDGRIEWNGNKIWNEADALQIQKFMSDSAHQQVFRDDTTGELYQLDPEGNKQTFAGRLRRAYMYGTKTDPDAVKFGVSAGNLPTSDYRYQPGRAASEGYAVGERGYGWESGPDGVDLNKNYMDMLLPYDVATKLEALVHGRKEAIDGRLDAEAYDLGVSGKSEYYTSPEAMLGDTSTFNGRLADVVDIGTVTPYEDKKEYVIKAKSATPITDELTQLVPAIGAGIGKGAVEIVDALQELGTYIPQTAVRLLTGDKDYDIDLINDQAKKSMIEGIDHVVGYDRAEDEAVLAQALEDIKASGLDVTSWENIKEVMSDPEKRSKLGSAALTVFSDPTLTLSMLSEIVGSGGVLGTGTKVVSKVGAKVAPKLALQVGKITQTNKSKFINDIKEIKNSSLDKAQKTAQIEALKDSYTISKKLPDLIRGTTFTNADMMVRVNNDIDAFMENNNGEEPSAAKLLQIVTLNRIVSSMEVESLKYVARIDDLGPNTVKALIKKHSKDTIKHLGKSGLLEAGQETIDNLVQVVNQKVGSADYADKTLQEVMQESSAEIALGTVAGAASGLHIGGAAGIGALLADAPSALSGGAQSKKEDEEEEEVAPIDVTAQDDVGIKVAEQIQATGEIPEDAIIPEAEMHKEGEFANTYNPDEVVTEIMQIDSAIDAIKSSAPTNKDELTLQSARAGSQLKLYEQKLKALNKLVDENSERYQNSKEAIDAKIVETKEYIDGIKEQMMQDLESMQEDEFAALSDKDLIRIFKNTGGEDAMLDDLVASTAGMNVDQSAIDHLATMSIPTQEDFGIAPPPIQEDFGIAAPPENLDQTVEETTATEKPEAKEATPSKVTLESINTKLDRLLKIAKAGKSTTAQKRIEEEQAKIKTIQSIQDEVLYGDKGLLAEAYHQTNIKALLSKAREEYIAQGLIPKDYKGSLHEVYSGLDEKQQKIATQISRKIGAGKKGWSIPNLEKRVSSFEEKVAETKTIDDKRLSAISNVVNRMGIKILDRAEELQKTGYKESSKLVDGKREDVFASFASLNEALEYMLDNKLISREDKPFEKVGKTEINYSDVIRKLLDDNYQGGIYSILEAAKGEREALEAINIDDEGNITISEKHQKITEKKVKETEEKAKKQKAAKEAETKADIEKVTGKPAQTKTSIDALHSELTQLKAEADKIVTNIEKIDEREQQAIAETLANRDNAISKLLSISTNAASIWNNSQQVISSKTKEITKIDDKLSKIDKDLDNITKLKNILVAQINNAYSVEGKEVTLQDLEDGAVPLTQKEGVKDLKSKVQTILQIVGRLAKGVPAILKEMLKLIKETKKLEAEKRTLQTEKDKIVKEIKATKKETKEALQKEKVDTEAIETESDIAKAEIAETKKVAKDLRKTQLEPTSMIRKDKDLHGFQKLSKLAERTRYNSGTKLQLLRNKIKELQDKFTTPYNAHDLLNSQASKYEDGETAKYKGMKIALPLQVKAYVTPTIKGSSYISVLNTAQLNELTDNKYNDAIIAGTKFLETSNLELDNEFANRVDNPFLTMITNPNGSINETIAAALYLTAANIVTIEGGKLIHKTKEQTARALGFNTVGELSTKAFRTFSRLTNRNHLANTAGDILLKTLGLTYNQEGGQESYARFKAGAGLLVLKYLEDMKILEPIASDNMATVKAEGYKGNTFTKERYDEILGNIDLGSSSTKALIPFVKVTSAANVLKAIEDLKEPIKQFNEALDITSALPTAQTRQPKEKTPEEYKIHPAVEPTQVTVDAMNELSKTENEIIDAVEYLISMPKEKALNLMKYVDTNDIFGLDNREEQEAKNLEKLREYEGLVEAYNDIKTGKLNNSMWFKYKTATAGRHYIQSVVLDNQTFKELQRWLIVPKAARRTYPKKAIQNILEGNITPLNSKYFGFIDGIAQAFKGDIDKDTPNTRIALAKELLNETEEQIDARISARKFDHLGHALQAKKAILDYQNSSVNVNTVITAEYDGITDGVIRKVLQFPLGDNTLELLAKGGYLTVGGLAANIMKQEGLSEDKALKRAEQLINSSNMGSLIANKQILDIYKTQAKATDLSEATVISQLTPTKENKNSDPLELRIDSVIMEYIPQTIDGEITKALREMFKDPTMVTQYGASIKNAIKKTGEHLAKAALDQAYEEYNETGTSPLIEALAKKVPAVKDAEQLMKLIDKKSLSDIKVNKYLSLQDAIDKTFTNAISLQMENTLMSILGPIIDVTSKINEASRDMFSIFEKAFEADLKKELEKHIKEGKEDTLPESKIIEIVNKNKKYLPLIKGPDSVKLNNDGTYEDGIIIAKNKLASPDNLLLENVEVVLENVPEGKSKSITARSYIRQIAESYAGAGVLPTQNEDGSNISHVVRKHAVELGIVGIHDAIVAAGADANMILQDYNKTGIDISMKYSQMEEILNAYTRSIKEGLKNNLVAKNKSLELLAELSEQATTVLDKKVTLWSTDMIVEHMPGFNAAVKYDSTDKANKKVIEDNINTYFGKMIERMELITDTNIPNKKELIGIIRNTKEVTDKMTLVKDFEQLLTGKGCE